LPLPCERQKIETQPLDPALASPNLIDRDIGNHPWESIGRDRLELEPLEDDEHGVREFEQTVVSVSERLEAAFPLSPRHAHPCRINGGFRD
jgi:hypothetical protein